jgi:pimeloyl-ACP methyl ester carboxylesterase
VPSWTTTLDLRVEVVDTARGPVETARTGAGPAVLCVHGIPGSWRQAVPLAEDLADRFDALVLACALSPHLVTPPRSWLLFRVPGLAEVLMPPLRAINRRRARKPANVDVVLTKSLTADEYARTQADPRIKADLLRHVLSHQEAPPSVAGLRNDYAQVSRRIASVPEASQVQCRALVLHGDADPVVTMAHARFHAQVLGAPLKVFDDAGHLFLLTRRAEASEAIRSFVSSL